VRRVRKGESPLDPELAARLLRRLASEGEMRRGTGSPHAAPYAEVLGLMKLGRTNRQIAGDLVISLGTAKNHVEHIISKLGVSGRTRAVVQALELGLIDLP
jgi:DNA-binding NarL/FixJ family response regulator